MTTEIASWRDMGAKTGVDVEFSELMNASLPLAPLISAGVATLALLASVAALIVSISSRRVAGRSLRLAKAKEERQLIPLELEILSPRSTLDSSGGRIISVEIQVANQSEVPSSIKSAALWVTYQKEGREHLSEVSASRLETEDSFPSPAIIPPRGTLRGWLEFSLDGKRVEGWTIQRYDLRLLDADSRTIEHRDVSLRMQQ